MKTTIRTYFGLFAVVGVVFGLAGVVGEPASILLARCPGQGWTRLFQNLGILRRLWGPPGGRELYVVGDAIHHSGSPRGADAVAALPTQRMRGLGIGVAPPR